MRELRDRVAVVTGAASGIGLALAERYAAEGMHVVLADVEEAALTVAADRLRAAGASVLAVTTDVSRADDVDALAVEAMGTFGGVHVLCNNAGVFAGRRPIWEVAREDWEWVLGVNL
jgi:NAD(P)-dependent dehydrogenase (short-subunit alcohol dehydrogenase family)